MSTQPNTENSSDLDRTEELPQLDVAAYEASLAEVATVSTDTWSVQALRDATLAEESDERAVGGSPRITPLRGEPEPPAIIDLTRDAERILSRVAQLEAELGSANALNEELESRCEALIGDLAEREQSVAALEADNARLREQHSIGLEKLQALQRRLEADGAESAAALERAQESHTAAAARAEDIRTALELRIVHLEEQTSKLAASNDRAREELRSATELAEAHAQAIEDLEDRLEDETNNSAQMARYLAAKLVEHDATMLALQQRERRLLTVEATCDELTSRLQQSTTEMAQLQERTTAAERELALGREEQRKSTSELELNLAESLRHSSALEGELAAARERIGQLELDSAALSSVRAELSDRSAEVTRAVGESAELRSEVERLRRLLEQQANDLAARDAAIEAARAALSEQQDENASLERELETAQSDVMEFGSKAVRQARQLEDAAAELQAVRQQLQRSTAAMQDLEVAVGARDELLASLRAELQSAQDERGIIAGQLEKSRARNKALAHDIFERDRQISTLKQDLAVHAETLAAIRQDVSRVDRVGAAPDESQPLRILEPMGHDGAPIRLDRKVITLGRTSDNDACIPSKLVSRHHARLLVGPNAVVLEDAGSTNGCYVNDRLVKQHLMRDGDVLSMGDLKYRLRTASPRPPQARDNVVPIGGDASDH